jgi:hypothetical protein
LQPPLTKVSLEGLYVGLSGFQRAHAFNFSPLDIFSLFEVIRFELFRQIREGHARGVDCLAVALFKVV